MFYSKIVFNLLPFLTNFDMEVHLIKYYYRKNLIEIAFFLLSYMHNFDYLFLLFPFTTSKLKSIEITSKKKKNGTEKLYSYKIYI